MTRKRKIEIWFQDEARIGRKNGFVRQWASRSWHGWHRHVSLVMPTFAMMAIIRHRANASTLKETVRHKPTTKPA